MGNRLGLWMLAILIGIAIFMLFVLQSPELSAHFKRPEGFYDDMFEKIGISLAFATGVSLVVWLARKLIK